MQSVSKILVPVDFSEQSANGLKYAASLAQKMNAELIALHVMSADKNGSFPQVLAAFEGWPMPPMTARQMPIDRQLGEKSLDLYNFIRKVLGNRSSPKIWREVKMGAPAKEIVAVARERRVALVVLEIPNKSLFSYLAARGALLKLTRKLPCPLLLTPPDSCTEWAGPGEPRLLADLRAPHH